jgi:hypothetical protein
MCMDQVEFIRPPGDFLDKRCLNSHGVGTGTAETKCPEQTGWVPRQSRDRAGKKRYFMAQIDELIDQPCDDPLSASVKLRGYTFR